MQRLTIVLSFHVTRRPYLRRFVRSEPGAFMITRLRFTVCSSLPWHLNPHSFPAANLWLLCADEGRVHGRRNYVDRTNHFQDCRLTRKEFRRSAYGSRRSPRALHSLSSLRLSLSRATQLART